MFDGNSAIKARIVFSERTIGIWFVTLPGVGDWLGHAAVNDDGSAEGHYRFRYAVDSKVWNSQDKKKWCELRAKGKDDLCAALSETSKTLAAMAHGERWELLRGTMQVSEFIRQFKQLPFVNIIEVPRARA